MPTTRPCANGLGFYYTPDPVVDFLVRAVDDLLRRDFGKPEGLADESVRLLDPATGTTTFLARAYRQVHQTMMEGGDAGLWPDRARDHLAKHFYGFERLACRVHAGPCEAASAACGTRRHARRYRTPAGLSGGHDDEPRSRTDEPAGRGRSEPGDSRCRAGSGSGKDFSRAGQSPYNVKSDNPSKDSAGKATFIGGLVSDYYKVNNQPLGEKNPKSLQDGYVKFIRFAQWRVERSGSVIVAFVTNNGYLGNPTFRGMWHSLMTTFDDIYIMDLHGNSNKKERSPDGTDDKNVFDIMQGVTIALFIRRQEPNKIRRYCLPF